MKPKRKIKVIEPYNPYVGQLSDEELADLSRLKDEPGWKALEKVSQLTIQSILQEALTSSEADDAKAVRVVRGCSAGLTAQIALLDVPNHARKELINRDKLGKEK